MRRSRYRTRLSTSEINNIDANGIRTRTRPLPKLTSPGRRPTHDSAPDMISNPTADTHRPRTTRLTPTFDDIGLALFLLSAHSISFH